MDINDKINIRIAEVLKAKEVRIQELKVYCEKELLVFDAVIGELRHLLKEDDTEVNEISIDDFQKKIEEGIAVEN